MITELLIFESMTADIQRGPDATVLYIYEVDSGCSGVCLNEAEGRALRDWLNRVLPMSVNQECVCKQLPEPVNEDCPVHGDSSLEQPLDPRMVKACNALREILAYEGHYATDRNPTIRAIKRIAEDGLVGSPEKSSGHTWTCEVCQSTNDAATAFNQCATCRSFRKGYAEKSL